MEKLSKDVGEDTSVLVIGDLGLGIESNLGGELGTCAGGHSGLLVEVQLIRGRNCEGLSALKPKRVSTLSGRELEGQDSHADQVASVDALIALSNDSMHTKEEGTLSSPVS